MQACQRAIAFGMQLLAEDQNAAVLGVRGVFVAHANVSGRLLLGRVRLTLVPRRDLLVTGARPRCFERRQRGRGRLRGSPGG